MKYLIAGIDLGSNSFRMLIGEVTQKNGHYSLKVIEKLKETVRLAGGLNAQGELSHEAIQSASQTLANFGERIKHFDPQHVMAVATNTYRVAKNQRELLLASEQALGFPIDIIPGHEEARLIYQGVAHVLDQPSERRLVVDIGGGSTEFIIGTGLQAHMMYSLPMGCLSYSRHFFSDGLITESNMAEAEAAAQQQIEAIRYPYKNLGWQMAYGSSGTSKALFGILTASGFEKNSISLKGMLKLRDTLIAAQTVENANLQGIKPDRIPVLAGGLAIMLAIFKSLNIKSMQPADGALRLGVLYDLLARDESQDIRDVTVKEFIERYHVDPLIAKELKRITLQLFSPWSKTSSEKFIDLLGWSAQLSHIGTSISQTDHTQHSMYIVEHADMPGFSSSDQEILGALVGGSYDKADELLRRQPTLKQGVLCLRLAKLMCHGANTRKPVPLKISKHQDQYTLSVNQKWLRLTLGMDKRLETEREQWEKHGLRLNIEILS